MTVPAESTTTEPSTGSPPASVAARSPASAAAISVPCSPLPVSVPSAGGAAGSVTVSDWSMVLSWRPVAIAWASTV